MGGRSCPLLTPGDLTAVAEGGSSQVHAQSQQGFICALGLFVRFTGIIIWRVDDACFVQAYLVHKFFKIREQC